MAKQKNPQKTVLVQRGGLVQEIYESDISSFVNPQKKYVLVKGASENEAPKTENNFDEAMALKRISEASTLDELYNLAEEFKDNMNKVLNEAGKKREEEIKQAEFLLKQQEENNKKPEEKEGGNNA